MSNNNEISSLAEIRERKAKVRLELDESKKAAASQLAATAGEAKTVVLRDVVLPAAGVALGIYVLSKVVRSISGSSSDKEDQGYVTTTYTRPAGASGDVSPALPAPAERNRIVTKEKPETINVKTENNTVANARKASLISLGHLLFPAGKAILNIIKENSK